MNQKGIAPLIIVAIIVVVAVVAVGIVLVATRGGGGESGGGGEGGGGVGEATSLQFAVDVATEGETYTMTFKAKDIGSNNMKIRVEGTAEGQEFIYIINGAQQKLWVYAAGMWVDLSDQFSDYWDMWSASFEGYQADLSGWTGGTWTSPDGTVTIRNIIVNPSLSDSLFEH